ncbi:MAG: hypothetical protein KDB65_08485 [Calditrichaeota bacterium]|nr:hypothetical protein [Calditrichota bacterium]
MKIIVMLAAAAWFSKSALAFHDGGTANCSMCHTIHNSENGQPVNPNPDNNYLLLTNSPTELCLSCHATEQGAVWSVNPLLPAPEHGGGNFIFVGAQNINDAPDGAQFPLSGSHGIHNCVAPSQGSLPDPDNAMSPGGTYPSSALGCTSCHDPHGNQNFRMLRGAGDVPAGDYKFLYPAPIAQGIAIEGAAESRENHTAYNYGWTNWCANCHGLFHEVNPVGFEHPVRGSLTQGTRVSYERYDGSLNPTGGDPFTSYLPQVPFQSNSVTTTSMNGPDGRSEIACITCHRAHGSSAVDLGRWDFRVAKLQLDGVVSGSFPISNPFNSSSERSLCVKCHEHETRTHGLNQACIECHRTSLSALQKLPPERDTFAK